MKNCSYCGRANADEALLCAGCGNPFDVSTNTETCPASTHKDVGRVLNAKIATIILLTYLAVQVFCGYFMAATEPPGRVHDPRNVNLMHDLVESKGLILSYIFGDLAMVFVSSRLIPRQVTDASPTGAAWVWGQWEAIAKGLALGLIIGICDQYLVVLGKHFVTHRNLDPANRMASTPGLTREIWFVTTLLLAPPIEEMMFRGVLYGGFRKSFGPLWAGVSTTLIFVMLHFRYYAHFQSNVIFIVIAAVATLWCRLRWSAIGPAISVHFGYNLVVALTVLYLTWR